MKEVMKLTVIDSLQGIKELKQYIASKDLLAYDSEATGLTAGDRVIGFSVCAEQDQAFYVILEKWNNNTLEPMPYLNEARDIILDLATKQLIMHNGVFDCMMAEAYFKVSLIGALHTDTMIMAHLLDENRRVGLKELAKSYFGVQSNKEAEEMKASVIANGGIWQDKAGGVKEMYKADSYLMGKYGAQDAGLTLKLFNTLLPELIDQGLDDFFYNDESMPMLRTATYDLNTTGLKVDVQQLTSLKKQLEAECLEAHHFIMMEIKPYIQDKYPGTTKKNTFNIGSSQQLAWLLYGKLELEFTSLTDSGKEILNHYGLKGPYTWAARRAFIATCETHKGKSYRLEGILNGKRVPASKIKEPWAYIKCDKKALTALSGKYEWIKSLLGYQRKKKILSTYIKGLENRIRYGIINPSFLQHGTTSGRYSSRDPNFQNLPRDDKRVKACIVSRPGKCFVGADYSQLEPRVFAYFSKDRRLLNAFRGTDDFYSVIGMSVYDRQDCTPKKEGSPDAFGVKYKKLRDLSKVIALASTYGATARQLASTTGKSVEATQEDIDNYFERFPGVKEMMLESHRLAKTNGYVTNLFGRPRRIPEAKNIPMNAKHEELPYLARNVLNLAVNHRIQSTGASIVNRASILFLENCKRLEYNVKLVVQVHDSLVAECDDKDAEDVSLILQHAMENAVKLEGIDLEAIPKIGKNLAEV